MRRVMLSILVVACGGTTSSSVQNEAPRAPKPKAVPCPNPDVLAALVAKPWGAGAKVEVCISLVRGGKQQFWLEGSADAPPDTMHEVPTKNGIVDERGQLSWHGPQQALGFGFMYQGRDEATDLDGDGNDEVLYERTTGEGGMSITQLVVVYFEPAPVVRTVPLGYMGGAGEQNCDGSWTVVPGTGKTRRIAVERTGNACEEKERRETYGRDDLDKPAAD